MNLLIRLSFLFILLILFSCSKDGPETEDPDPGDGPVIDTVKTIGSSGGQLQNEDLYLEIPEGAFDSDNEIVISSGDDQDAFGDKLVSGMYRIEGLPAGYSKSLELKIKYDGSLSDNSFIAVGEEVMPSSMGELITAYHLQSAEDSSGWLVGELPVPESGKKAAGKEIRLPGETDLTGFVVGCISSYGTVYSSGNHFAIQYPMLLVSNADAQDLGDYLEEAYAKFRDQLGFSYSNRTIWPVQVVVKPFPFSSEAFGYYTSSILGNNFGWMEFNSAKISDKEQMRLTAGHEFFHLVQALYDNRNPYSKAKFESDNLWLHEATAVWSEKMFSDKADYASAIVQPYQMAPFNGLYAGISSGAQNHGYGMSGLFNYLTDRYGEDCLVDIYGSVYEDVHAIDAISQNAEEPVNWLEGFFREYVLCNLNVYGVGAAYWRQNMHGTYAIDDINDIGTTFTESYPDLSARLYKIDMTDNEIDDNDKLVFSLEGEGVSEVSILKYKQGNIEFVANSTSKISLKDIKKEYLDTGWNLFALVCNNRAVPPYTGKSFIDLKIDVVREQESPDYNHCSISIKVLGHYHATTPDTSYNYDSDGPIYTWEKYPGSFTENTFTGNYFRDYGTFSISGSITVVLNETHDTIESVSWTEEHTSPNFTKTYTGAVAGIPFAYSDMFRVEGESSCDHITSFSVNQSAPNGLNYSLKSYECAWDSKIVVSFSKE